MFNYTEKRLDSIILLQASKPLILWKMGKTPESEPESFGRGLSCSAWLTRRDALPLTGASFHSGKRIRPAMQSRRVEVRAIRPHESMNLAVYANLIEKFPVSQRPINCPLQNQAEIYGSF